MPNGTDKIKNYLGLMYGGLVVLIIAISTFVYSLIMSAPSNSAIEYEVSNGVMSINPGGSSFPTTEPHVNPPLDPPPGQ